MTREAKPVERRSISTKERLRLFALHGGRCHICGDRIDGIREPWDVEHVIPWALTRDDSDKNRQPAHRGGSCHGAKTKTDVKAIAKAKRIEAKHKGAWAKKGRAIPGSKASGMKRGFDGRVTRR